MPSRPLSAPLAELSAGQLNDFLQGAAEFSKTETPQSGLGPIFNNVSCVSCHFIGGAGELARRRSPVLGAVWMGISM